MSVRRWQPPALVIDAACSSTSADPLARARLDDIARGLQVGQSTLAALVASAETPPAARAWAAQILRRVSEAEQARVTETLVSSGFDETGCNPQAYGVIDPEYDGERIVAVVRAGAAPESFERVGAVGWEPCEAPYGMPYLDLRGEVLAEAIETVAAGASLLLHSAEPTAWISAKEDPALVAAADAASSPASPGDDSSIYAVVDPLNTSAVLLLFHVAPGPMITVRKAGAWAPDDGTLKAQLTGLNPPPVVAVAPAQVPDVLRQVDDFDTSHQQTAAGPNSGQAPQAQTTPPTPPTPGAGPTPAAAPAAPLAAAAQALGLTEEQAQRLDDAYAGLTADAGPDEPRVAGLAVRAADTGRVFMLQRGLDEESDPAKGQWEFPGGHREDDDPDLQTTAEREWMEETGHPLPEGIPGASWDSSNGVYRGFIRVIPNEADINLADRKVGVNPDDPDSDSFEAAAWWDPTHIAGNQMVRPELAHSMHLVHVALNADAAEPAMVASMHHMRRIREAKSADALWEANRAAGDLAEQGRRRDFETMISSRYAALRAEGHDESTSASTVRREIEAETARRDLWEKHRSEDHLAEKERRLRVQPDVHLSKELVTRYAEAKASPIPPVPLQALAADAVPHTMLPPQLFKYWVAGKGTLKIKWGIRGDWQRCRDHLTKYVKSDYQTKALCAELHKFATGRWTGSHANKIAEG